MSYGSTVVYFSELVNYQHSGDFSCTTSVKNSWITVIILVRKHFATGSSCRTFSKDTLCNVFGTEAIFCGRTCSEKVKFMCQFHEDLKRSTTNYKASWSFVQSWMPMHYVYRACLESLLALPCSKFCATTNLLWMISKKSCAKRFLIDGLPYGNAWNISFYMIFCLCKL